MDSEKVWEITSLELEISKTFPPLLTVYAEANVPSTGYTHAQLEPYVYITPPANGIYEFDFVATPPQGIAAEVISPIKAEPYKWPDYPKTLKGVKVYAKQNSMTTPLPTEPTQ